MAKQWYDEKIFYDFMRPQFTIRTGHFTQMIWKSTKRIGIGFAFNRSGDKVFLVVNYTPSGNFLDQFPDNVLPEIA
jgi:glioma pathogenesis-related protein 2